MEELFGLVKHVKRVVDRDHTPEEHGREDNGADVTRVTERVFGEEEGTALHLGFPRVFCLAMRGQGLHKPGVHEPPHGASVYVINGH